MSKASAAKTKGRKAFTGDGSGSLPRQMIEPYRLWFEFLKAALSDPKMTVDRSIYKDWGAVQNADFDDWWKDHWQLLFAEPVAGVAVVRSIEECQSALRDDAYAIVKVPLNLPSKVRVAELEKVVKAERKQRTPRKTAHTKALFTITARRALRRDVLRGMLRLYQLHLLHHRDVEKTSVAYFEWATEWNSKVQAKGWNRPPVYVPPQLKTFVEAIRLVHAATKPAEARTIRRDAKYDISRSKIRRYIHRAEKIARNVSRGIFPGEFA